MDHETNNRLDDPSFCHRYSSRFRARMGDWQDFFLYVPVLDRCFFRVDAYAAYEVASL
jgi:hypothetical protein